MPELATVEIRIGQLIYHEINHWPGLSKPSTLLRHCGMRHLYMGLPSLSPVVVLWGGSQDMFDHLPQLHHAVSRHLWAASTGIGSSLPSLDTSPGEITTRVSWEPVFEKKGTIHTLWCDSMWHLQVVTSATSARGLSGDPFLHPMLRHSKADICGILTSIHNNSCDFFCPLQTVVKRNTRCLDINLWLHCLKLWRWVERWCHKVTHR